MPCLMCLWILTWNFLIKWLCFLANSLNFLHSLSYLKPCFISLCVNSVCFALKALKLSQILPILTSWDMYTPYVGFAGILPSKNGNRTTLKEKLSLLSYTDVLKWPLLILISISKYDSLLDDSVVFFRVSSGG